VDARKNVIQAEGAWELFQGAESLHVGRGKKTVIFTPDVTTKEEILKVTLGRTGNLRAPTLRVGQRFYVGYNEEMYRELIR
jgi:ATPase subunit of ABC transporter with duplicated ATPase domains